MLCLCVQILYIFKTEKRLNFFSCVFSTAILFTCFKKKLVSYHIYTQLKGRLKFYPHVPLCGMCRVPRASRFQASQVGVTILEEHTVHHVPHHRHVRHVPLQRGVRHVPLHRDVSHVPLHRDVRHVPLHRHDLLKSIKLNSSPLLKNLNPKFNEMTFSCVSRLHFLTYFRY